MRRVSSASRLRNATREWQNAGFSRGKTSRLRKPLKTLMESAAVKKNQSRQKLHFEPRKQMLHPTELRALYEESELLR
jgi:hypothetical protein